MRATVPKAFKWRGGGINGGQLVSVAKEKPPP